MKQAFLGVLLALVPACVAVDAPQEETSQPSAEQTLANDLEGWCDSTCARLEVCPEECDCQGDECTCTGVGDDCREDCQEALEDYLGKGDACAEVGRGLMSCIDGITTCDDLNDARRCNEPPNADAVCERAVDDRVDDGDDGDDGDDDDVAEPTDAPPRGLEPGGVTCRAAAGGGTAGAAGGGNVAAFSCQTLYEDCSDGARYQFVCNGNTELATCNCFRSGEFTGSFDRSPASCPSDAEVNAGCGWNLDNGY